METALNICASNFATENCIFYQQLMHVHSIIAMVSPSESPSSLSSPPCRFEVSLQQNKIVDVFIDDYRSLSDSDDIMGNKSDTNLKVQLSLSQQ